MFKMDVRHGSNGKSCGSFHAANFPAILTSVKTGFKAKLTKFKQLPLANFE